MARSTPAHPGPPSFARALPRLALRTARQSRRQYERSGRPPSAARAARIARPNLDSPVFVIGSPRSGTTFLGSCLAALPGLSYHYEPVATKYAARLVYDGTWGFARARRFYRAVYGCLAGAHLDADLRFAEKTPRNCFLVPFLARAFPGAVFVYIERDGRDAALSHSKKPWLQRSQAGSGRREPGGHAYGAARFYIEPERAAEFEATTDIHRCIWAWRRHVEAARSGLAALPPSRVHTVRYEALVADPEGEGGRVLDALGVRDAEARARFGARAAEARPDSVGGWRRELSDAALAQVEAEAGPLLRSLRYG
jgi:LPS sulfotransferase NodH